MVKQTVFLKQVPACAEFHAEVVVGLYKENGQLVKLVQEGQNHYRQVRGGPKQHISKVHFHDLWDKHQKIRLVKTDYFCPSQQIKIMRFHACLDGLIVARGLKIPSDWPIAEINFRDYAKNIPQIAEWKDLLF